MTFKISEITALLLLLILASCAPEKSDDDDKKKEVDSIKKEIVVPNNIGPIAPQVDVNRIKYNEKSEAIEDFFEQQERGNEFNGSILIADKGDIIFKQMKGYSDLKLKDTLTNNSVFQLADVSNQFTAMAIMYLYEKGKLNFTDSIQKYLPAFPYWGVTIKQLLTHHSGLPNYQSICDKYANKNSELSNRDLYDIIIKYKPKAYYEPNTKFVYNNTGYSILTILVEEISGIKFEDFMMRRIFIPLGMKETYIHSPRNSIIPKSVKITKGYNSRSEEIGAENTDGIIGDKNVYTTINDLFIWDRALCEAKIISQKTLDEAYATPSNSKPGEKHYGYGWRIKTTNKNHKQIYSSGKFNGYSALYIRLPHRESCIIMLSNKQEKNLLRSYPRLLKILDPEVF